MNIIQQIEQSFKTLLISLIADSDVANVDTMQFTVNVDAQRQQFGDISTNAALVLAKQLSKSPRQLATLLVESFVHEAVDHCDIAGPGFINIYLSQAAFITLTEQLLLQGHSFFKPSTPKKQRISIEFVSANPTGPVHFGHGRNGIIGDVLATILSFLGYEVTKEFYINDAGAQIEKLGKSLKIRCQQIAGQTVDMPEDAYHGEYLIAIAQHCYDLYGSQLLQKPDSFFSNYAKEQMLLLIKQTLDQYGIHYDMWFSEKTLHDSGAIEKVIDELTTQGFIYQQDGAWWFKSTQFGDDKDRVVRKASGELTYVAADIAYLKNKADRGFDHLIMVLGHDHHSYVTRLQGLLRALNLRCDLEIILYQLVKIKASGSLVRMSKRAGNIVTLQDVIETVGTDVARFFYLHRKPEAQLEFDLNLALTRSDENPVYYIQYAYVRTGSILQKAIEHDSLQQITIQDLKCISSDESLLIKKMASLIDTLSAIEKTHQTHLIAYYTHELAQLFNHYYAHHKVIDMQHIERSRTRLALVQAVRSTLALCLHVMGLSQPEKM